MPCPPASRWAASLPFRPVGVARRVDPRRPHRRRGQARYRRRARAGAPGCPLSAASLPRSKARRCKCSPRPSRPRSRGPARQLSPPNPLAPSRTSRWVGVLWLDPPHPDQLRALLRLALPIPLLRCRRRRSRSLTRWMAAAPLALAAWAVVASGQGDEERQTRRVGCRACPVDQLMALVVLPALRTAEASEGLG